MPHSPGQQNLALFRIYVAYRSLLSVVLLIMLVSPNTRQLVGSLNPALYLSVALAYLATSVPLVGSLSTRSTRTRNFCSSFSWWTLPPSPCWPTAVAA